MWTSAEDELGTWWFLCVDPVWRERDKVTLRPDWGARHAWCSSLLRGDCDRARRAFERRSIRLRVDRLSRRLEHGARAGRRHHFSGGLGVRLLGRRDADEPARL